MKPHEHATKDNIGTLTEGPVGVTDTLLLSSDIDEEEMLRYAAVGPKTLVK